MDRTYSVVIPAYNTGLFIGEAIDSLLAQSEPPANIIVIDDGSSDNTAAAAQAITSKITIIRQNNRGCGGATNAGIAAVVTPIIAFLDSDDVWLPEKAVTQLNRLEAEPNISGVFAKGHTFKGPAATPLLGPVNDLFGRTTLMMRTEAAHRIGPLAENLPGNMGELADWIQRGRALGMIFELMDANLAMRRVRPGSLSYVLDEEKRRGYITVAKRALDRRRAMSDEEHKA